MLKITCLKCHTSWSLNHEATQAALDSLEPGATYYAAVCPKCRRTNKVAVKQLEQALPHTSTTDSND